MARAANWASDMTGPPTFRPWAWAANWLLSSVVTHPVSWVRTTSGSASSFMTSILRWVAKDRVKSRWTRMWRNPNPPEAKQGERAQTAAPRAPPHPGDEGGALPAVDVGVEDGVALHQLVVV